MIAEFAKRRGYDMKPWLPALTGRIVESAEATDRFLWDFRKTLDRADRGVPLRPADRPPRGARHGALHRVARSRPRLHRRRHGGQGEGRHPDERDVDRAGRAGASARYDADIRESASVAHIYGQNLVAAESLTAGSGGAWSFSPETLKPTADREMSMGLNRFVIHTSVHQPVERQDPGPRPRAVRPVVHPARDLGGAGQGLDHVPRPQLLHAAAGQVRGRHRLLLRRGLQHHRPVPGQPAADSGRLQLRLRRTPTW